MSLSHYRPAHTPILFLGTAMLFGGMIPLWNPASAMREYGLPPRIQRVPEAQACFTIYGSRATMTGMAIWMFYLQNKLEVVDGLLGLLGYASAVDAWVCWKEGVPKQGIFRGVAGGLVAAWGWWGMTARY